MSMPGRCTEERRRREVSSSKLHRKRDDHSTRGHRSFLFCLRAAASSSELSRLKATVQSDSRVEMLGPASARLYDEDK